MEDWLSAALATLQKPQTAVELGLMVACLLLAALFTRAWGRQRTEDREHQAKAARIGMTGLRRLTYPLVALILLLVARFLVRRYMGQPVILPMAMTLLLAMAVIRMVAFALIHTFAKGVLIVGGIRIVSTLVWITVALHLLGLLPDVITLLDDIAFHVGKQRLSLWLLLQGGVTVMLSMLLALWASGQVEERLHGAEGLDSSLKVLFSRLSRALFMLVAILLTLPMVGIDLTTLSVFGGALGVGLGLGLQKIASNYVSGFILLLERSIRIGNVIAVGTDRGEVTRITTRYTVLKSVTGVEALVPNEVLVGSVVQNESYSDSRVRQSVHVQVAYGTDLPAVLELLVCIAKAHEHVLQDPPPRGFVLAFADSGINLELGFWIDDPTRSPLVVKSELYLAIWKAFQERGISIPFPQREVRMLGNTG